MLLFDVRTLFEVMDALTLWGKEKNNLDWFIFHSYLGPSKCTLYFGVLGVIIFYRNAHNLVEKHMFF